MREEFEKWTKTLHPELQETVEGSEIFFMTFRGGATSRQPEIDALKDVIKNRQNEVFKLSSERLTLKAENERLRKDAERYRWLADQDLDDRIFIVRGTNGTWGECGHSGFGGYKDHIDEVIDAAMKEAK